VIAILSFVIIVGVAISFKNVDFFHRRAGMMGAVATELRVYAHDHGGWFPRSDKDSLDALRKLYPDYAGGPELAGLSGDIDAVMQCLKEGKPLTGKSSWVYVQGLKNTDDPTLALLWDSHPGRYGTGVNQRGPVMRGHVVSTIGMINGFETNVVDADWTNFLRQQEELRKAALASRAAQGNAEGK
jgi:hypothetical protein